MADDPLRSLGQLPGIGAGIGAGLAVARLLGRLRPRDHPKGTAWTEHEDGWPWKRKVLCQYREDGTLKITPLRPTDDVPDDEPRPEPRRGFVRMVREEVRAKLKRR
jgi:hypothetical protein